MDPCPPPELAPPERLWQLASWLLSRSGDRATRLIVRRLGEVGARKGHYTVLAALDELGATSQADLCRRLGVDRSDVSALIDELEEAGLLLRERDEEDRRRNVIRLTRAGRRRFAELDAIVGGVQDELLVPLSDQERKQFHTLLTRIVEHGVVAHAVEAGERSETAAPRPVG